MAEVVRLPPFSWPSGEGFPFCGGCIPMMNMGPFVRGGTKKIPLYSLKKTVFLAEKLADAAKKPYLYTGFIYLQAGDIHL